MDSDDVSDATDWLRTKLAVLMHVEQAFRCHVCKEFYTSPMITSCCHTFCSLCIRRSLGDDGKCPLCRAADQENKLRGNWALREAVEAFVKARATVLEVARTQAATAEFPAENAASAINEATSPKRKADSDIEDDEVEHKRLRTSTRRSKAKAAEANAVIMRTEAAGMDHKPNDGLVACPVCLTRMMVKEVDRHLDISCPGFSRSPPTTTASSSKTESSSKPAFPTTTTASSSASSSSKPPDRLPPLNYSMLNDQALRKKLSTLGIATSGSRQLLERRHKEWVTIWNANCDSATPKKRTELLRDLNVWERTVGAPAASRSSAVGAQIRDKDFDGDAWAAKHVDSYKDLIASARRTTRAKVTSETSSGNESGGLTPSQPLTVVGSSPGAPPEEDPEGEGLIDLTSSVTTTPPHGGEPACRNEVSNSTSSSNTGDVVLNDVTMSQTRI